MGPINLNRLLAPTLSSCSILLEREKYTCELPLNNILFIFEF